METNSILLETLTKKEGSIIDFWETKQKEIGISKLEFWVQLNKSIDFYYNEIEKKSRKKNLPKIESLKKLEQPLLKWEKEINALIYYYDYNRPKVFAVNNSSLWKQFEFLKNLNILSFSNELKNKPAEQITEFLDFHLRYFKRQYEKFSNWNELLAEWFRQTKKQIPSTFTPQQKDRFLTWFENQAEVPKQKTNVEELPTTFEDLVHGEYSIQPFIDILKEVEPPLIDADCNFIGKSKGAIAVWIDELFKQAIIKKPTNSDKVISLLVTKKIIGLTISDSTFRKARKNADKNYKEDFKTLISKVKLSQNSQKGKLGK